MPDKKILERGQVVAELVITIVSRVAATFIADGLFASSADVVLILFGLWIGHADGRPMTIGKLAQYIGMPRPTVARKLKEMEASGLVKPIGPGKYVRDLSGPGVREAINSLIEANTKSIHKAAAQLSKLDSL
jgi:DNA-binding transcriptional ArsR family regulator